MLNYRQHVEDDIYLCNLLILNLNLNKAHHVLDSLGDFYGP